MPYENKFENKSGILLSRKISGENNLIITLFLKDLGILRVTAHGAQSGTRFGGKTEPLISGSFHLRLSQRTHGYVLEDVEIFDDMLFLRSRHEALFKAIEWIKLIKKYLPYENPDNILLANLYYSMKLLYECDIPVDAVNFRFIWRWLYNWGLAPDFREFFMSKNYFKISEKKTLYYLSKLDVNSTRKLFSNEVIKNLNSRFYKTASKLIIKFLNEK